MSCSDDLITSGVVTAIDSVPTIGIRSNEIAMDTEIDDLDSLQLLELQDQLESTFDKRIPLRRLVRMKTLGDVVRYFQKKKASLRSTTQPA